MQMNFLSRYRTGLGLMVALVLTCGSGALGQTEPLQTLTAKLEQYHRQTLQEKLFVHVDRSFYLAGETMWFKVYNVDGTAHQPLDVSKVVYLEVLDRELVPVLQAKVELDEGTGQGSLALPVSLNSGPYLVRAYTNWMKNFGSAYYFEQPVTVINTFKKLGLKPVEETASYDIQFFPEGGHLVDGLQSKVAFKATDRQGKGVPVQGFVMNGKNDTLARFSSLVFGMGHFSFTPGTNQDYRALVRMPDGRTLTRTLPIIQEQGLVMHLADGGSDELSLTVSSRTQTTDGSPKNVYLLVHTRNALRKAEARTLNASGQATFTISKKALGDGVSHFTVFNNARQPVAERLYFQQPRQPLLLQGATDQPTYGPRQQVRLSLNAEAAGSPAAADLSVAVYRLDSLQAASQNPDILSYLWLTADLRGPVEEPGYYFSQSSPAVAAAADNLMLTHGWRRFRWEEVLTQKEAFSFAHPPEYGGHLIRGRVLDKRTGEPAPNILTYLASPSRQIRLLGSRSNRKGEILFDVKDLYGSRDLILQTNTRRDSTYRFELASPFSPEPPARRLPVFDLAESFRPLLQNRSLHLQVQNVHAAATPIRFHRPAVDSTAFYGQADKTYLLDDYTRFPVMEEVMREYVAPVMVRKRRGKFHFLVHNDPHKAVFQVDPLVLLDGVPVFDTDKIMAYDPRKVQKLEVMSRLYLLGPISFKGIVSYTTYSGTMPDFEIDPRSLLVDYEGLQLKREFYAPRYETPEQVESRVPDLRNLLYWAPSLTTDRLGKGETTFFTSDLPGTYLVVVQGLTKAGHAGGHAFTFDVKRPL